MSEPIQAGVLMDPIAATNPRKDSTLAMLLEAQRRQWTMYYMEQGDLFLLQGKPRARARRVRLADDPEQWKRGNHWFELGPETTLPLDQLQVILMRKDPPFNTEYIYTTYLLELAEAAGVVVVNRPRSLRDANEKMFTAWFPQCSPPTLVSRSVEQLRGFLAQQHQIVLKPLDAMGGRSVFVLQTGDLNVNVLLETATDSGQRFTLAQRYIADVQKTGDKRILLVDGEPVPQALARIPAAGEFRGNLAAGAKGVGTEIDQRDRWICQQLSPRLREMGLLFVGLDIIGGFLTEINVTSPTGIREIQNEFQVDVSAILLSAIERRVTGRG